MAIGDLRPPLTDAAARAWQSVRVPDWLPRLLFAGAWVAAIVAAVAGTQSSCTAGTPVGCQDYSGFWLAFPLCVATPVLLLWMPLAGCACGLLFGVAELALDPEALPRQLFTGLGAACALLGVALLLAARRQRAALAAAFAAYGLPAPEIAQVSELRRASSWRWRRVAGACAAVAVAAVMLVAWWQQSAREQEHVARSVVVLGTISAYDADNYAVTVDARLPNGDPRHVHIGVNAAYHPGDHAAVRLDPQDPTWGRLVGEPADTGGWLVGSVFAVLLAAVLLVREVCRRRAAWSVTTGSRPRVAVRLVGPGLVLPVDSDRVVARLRLRSAGRIGLVPRVSTEVQPEHPDADVGSRGVDEEDAFAWSDEDDRAFGAWWRGEAPPPPELADLLEPSNAAGPAAWGEPPRAAVLCGDLRDRGWVAVYVDDQVQLPTAPLRFHREHPARDRLRSWRRHTWRPTRRRIDVLDELREAAAGEPVVAAAATDLPREPVTVGPPRRVRLRGAAMVIAVAVAGPAVVLGTGRHDWYSKVLVAVAGLRWLRAGLTLLVQRVDISHEALVVVGGRRVVTVPWEKVHGVRLAGDTLRVAWSPDVVTRLGPFAPSDSVRSAADTAGSDEARRVASLIMLMRERAVAIGSRGRAITVERGLAADVAPWWLVLVVGLSLWRIHG